MATGNTNHTPQPNIKLRNITFGERFLTYITQANLLCIYDIYIDISAGCLGTDRLERVQVAPGPSFGSTGVAFGRYWPVFGHSKTAHSEPGTKRDPKYTKMAVARHH